MYVIALSLQNGITVGSYEDGTAGSADDAFSGPFAVAMGFNGSFYVYDYHNNRVMHLYEGSTLGAQVVGSTSSGSGLGDLNSTTGLYVDALSNIYVNDDFNYRVMFWRNGSSKGKMVAGNGNQGSTLYTLSESVDVTVDSDGNIYVSESSNHRVTRWVPNATSATLVAGESGAAGNEMNQLNQPMKLYLDELHSHLYIADMGNHRIQRITLGGSTNATTVAGGNGPGSDNDQLSFPTGMYVSRKTGAIYIADSANDRITRWNAGATSGVTIVGIDQQSGTSPMLLNNPIHVIMNLNETLLYVCDSNNNRIQRFQLI